MKRFFSINTILAIVFCFAVSAAFVAHAYTPPSVAVPGDNNEVTAIDVSATDQVKAGGLAVSTFLAGTHEGGALFNQQATFKKTVRGGYPGDPSSTVTVGSDLGVNGTLTATSYLNAKSLKHSSGETPICGTADGTIVLCP